MADYSNYANGVRSRFGSGFQHWKTSYDTQPSLWANSDILTRPNTHREHLCRPVIVGSDGRTRPVILESPPKCNYKQATTAIEENPYRVQHVSPHTKDYVTDERKMGFSGGIFQHPSLEYDPTMIKEAGRAWPSPNGWESPPEAPLRKVTNNFGTATEYLRGSAGLPSSIGWSGSDPNVRRGQVGPTSTRMYSDFGEKKGTATIDSREAVKKYGGKFTW